MPRDIPVGNGKLLVTFDQDYCLRDIYYPCVGKENHTNGHKFRFGLWVDRSFNWIDRNWQLSLEYADESLITQVNAANEGLKVALFCNDIVDYRENIYIKKIVVRNLADMGEIELAKDVVFVEWNQDVPISDRYITRHCSYL